MIGMYLETYRHESGYFFSCYSISLESTYLFLFDSMVAPEMICLMSACLILLLLLALIFGKDPWSDAYLDNFIHLFLCHGFRHKLWFLFASYWACEPIFYLLGSFWYLVSWVDMVCTMSHLLKTMVNVQCSSLL
jgi:hypothetical protein